MQQYFNLFDQMIALLEPTTDKEDEFDMEAMNTILEGMEQRATANPKLKPEIKSVEMYKSAIPSLFQDGSDSGPKQSFLDQRKVERESLEKFARDHGLM